MVTVGPLTIDVAQRLVLVHGQEVKLTPREDAYFLPGGLRYALVMQADHLVGLITLSDIRHIPREQWGQVPVSNAMIPLARLRVATPQQSLSDVLPLMAGRDVNQLPVVQNGALVGIVSRDAIVQYLEIRRSLGLESVSNSMSRKW